MSCDRILVLEIRNVLMVRTVEDLSDSVRLLEIFTSGIKYSVTLSYARDTSLKGMACYLRHYAYVK
jgi:hypothetical protein